MMPIEKIILLNQIELFSSMHTDQIRALSKITEEDYRKQGETLWNKGDADGRLIILVKGEIEVDKTLYKKHQVIGQETLFSDSTYTHDAVCIKDCDYLIIEKEQLEALILQTPKIAIALLKIFSK